MITSTAFGGLRSRRFPWEAIGLRNFSPECLFIMCNPCKRSVRISYQRVQMQKREYRFIFGPVCFYDWKFFFRLS